MAEIEPTPEYSYRNEQEFRREMLRQLGRTHKKDGQLILISPDGTPFEIQVSNVGIISAVAV